MQGFSLRQNAHGTPRMYGDKEDLWSCNKQCKLLSSKKDSADCLKDLRIQWKLNKNCEDHFVKYEEKEVF